MASFFEKLILVIFDFQGSFLQHIQMETGANVMLRGRGSGMIDTNTGKETLEPLTVLIE